jgi:hypothetical protein
MVLEVPCRLGRRQSLKVVYARGATRSIGANFTTYSVACQILWLDRN